MRYVVKTILVLLVTCDCTAQISSDSINLQVKRIRAEFQRINSPATKYKVVTEDIEGESTEGAELKKYYTGSALRKATVVYYGEMGRLNVEYYFKDGELIFAPSLPPNIQPGELRY